MSPTDDRSAPHRKGRSNDEGSPKASAGTGDATPSTRATSTRADAGDDAVVKDAGATDAGATKGDRAAKGNAPRSDVTEARGAGDGGADDTGTTTKAGDAARKRRGSAGALVAKGGVPAAAVDDEPTGGSVAVAEGIEIDDRFANDYDGFGEDDWDDDAAPAVVRTSRRRKRKEWRQTERARRYAARRSVRFPIFTRSVLLWMLLFALVGTAFGGSGAIFWAHFNTQIQELKEQTSDFDKRSKDAQGEIEAMRNQAISDINNQIKPIAPYIAESKTIQLAPVFAPFVWFVHTFDEEGLNSVGSAFPVATDGANTLMVASFNTVKSNSLTPAPPIELSKGDDRLTATLVAFDADRDLALLSVPRGGMQVLEWATDEQQSQALGLRVFPVSGFGGAGASLTSGVISDQNAAGFLHDARIGNQTQGGPIVTADGKVLGVASIAYFPLGFDPGEMHFSIPVNQVCVVLMECGGGARRAKATGKPPVTTKK